MSDTQVQAGACPKCFGPLDADTFWCRSCYYRQLEQPPLTEAVAPRATQEPVDTNAVNSVRCALAFTVSVLSVVAASVLSRFLFEPGSFGRFWYSVIQIVAGIVAFTSAHIVSYVHGLRFTDDLEVGDVISNPLNVWRAAIADLPASWPRVTLGVGGLLAVFLGATIVEGVTLDHVIGERDFPGRADTMRSIVSQTVKSGRSRDAGKSDVTLEEAIEEFTGHGTDAADASLAIETDDTATEVYSPWDTDTEKETHRADATVRPTKLVRCVVIGFALDRDGRINELALGAMFNDRLQFAGVVRDGVASAVSDNDALRLRELNLPQPAIPCPEQVTEMSWVRPAVICDVKCRAADESGRLLGPVLAGIRQPKR